MFPFPNLLLLGSTTSLAGAAFDSGTKGTGITLSNSNYTATKAGAGYSGAKSLYAKKTGKWYFEATLDVRVSDGSLNVDSVGVARIDQGYTAVASGGLGAEVFVNGVATGRFWVDGVVAADLYAPGPPGTGDRLYFAIDLDNSLAWAKKSTGNWNASGTANPATGIGGASLGDISGYALTPFATIYHDTAAFSIITTLASMTGSLPSGFSAWSAASPLDNSGLGNTTLLSVKNANITLSNANLTGTRSATSALARSRDPKGEGKQYFEFTVGAWAGTNDGVGLVEPSATYTDVGPSGAKCGFIFKSGNIWANGANSGTSLSAITNGTRIDCAVDWANQKIWFRKASGNWNNSGTANPATNTGGISISTHLAMSPGATFGGSGSASGNNITLNAGSTAFGGTVPSGFESGWDVEGNP